MKINRLYVKKSNNDLKLNEIDIEKIVSTLDTITKILKNKNSLDFLFTQFKSNPTELIGLLSKASSLKGVLNTSKIDLSSIIDNNEEKS